MENIERIIEKYFEGETTLEEETRLRSFFSREDIPEHLQSYADQFRYYESMGKLQADVDLFSGIDAGESLPETLPSGGHMKWTLRIAAGLILLLTGFSAGLLLNGPQAGGEELAALQREVQQMKSALIYREQNSASERISAVNRTVAMNNEDASSRGLGREITDILVITLNNDENVNVRQSAAEALFRFRDEPEVRRALVNSLPRQKEPLMQITLIEMLVEMKEKSAVNEMQKLLMDSDTREIVRTRLQGGIAELKST